MRLMLRSPSPFRAAYIVLAVGAVTLAVAFANSEDIWKLKPPSDWTAEECAKVLEDSPWARSERVSVPKEPRARPTSYPGSTPPTFPSGDSEGADTVVYLIRWESAEPVQAAFVRLEELGERERARQASAPTRWPPDRYVITVKTLRLPEGVSDPLEEFTEEQLRDRARLKTSQGEFRVEGVERRGMGEASAVHFFFARQRGKKPILSTETETVEFSLFKRGRFKIGTQFLLEPEWLH